MRGVVLLGLPDGAISSERTACAPEKILHSERAKRSPIETYSQARSFPCSRGSTQRRCLRPEQQEQALKTRDGRGSLRAENTAAALPGLPGTGLPAAAFFLPAPPSRKSSAVVLGSKNLNNHWNCLSPREQDPALVKGGATSGWRSAEMPCRRVRTS